MILLSFDSDLACNIDGFIAVVGHTHVIKAGPVTGRAADVLAAVFTATQVMYGLSLLFLTGCPFTVIVFQLLHGRR